MPAPTTTADFLGLVRDSGLIDEDTLTNVAFGLPREPAACAGALVKAELLTPFQAKQLLAGRVRGLVLGAYRILRPIGKGGMGVVYLARHAALGRKVAVKVLAEQRSREELGLERFYREARAAAALDHPNIVRLHDVASIDGTHFLVMEFVDGTDLQALVDRTGPLPAARAAGYVAQAAAGLQHAHDRGFVHRDIKPANLIVGRNGRVKVLDMGLAQSLGNPDDELTGKLGEGFIAGTADFLSPEQALNVRLDARTDVYSLGATLYALLTGRPPYAGGIAQKLVQHQFAAPPDVRAVRPEVPAELAAVVARMMAKEPAERYQTARAARAALAPWVPGVEPESGVTVPVRTDATAADLPEAVADGPREARGSLARLAVIGCVALAVLLALALVFAAFRDGPNHAPVPDSVTETAVVAPPPRPTAAPVSRPIHTFELSQGVAFRSRYQDRRHDDPAAFELVGSGVFLHCWKTESVAEFRGDPGAGRPWVEVTNLNDELSSQIIFQFDDAITVPLVAGKWYRVRFEYRTANEAEGRASVRNPKKGGFASLADARLSRTEGSWAAAEMTFRRPAGGKIDVCVVNTTAGEGNALAVRGVDVFECEPGP